MLLGRNRADQLHHRVVVGEDSDDLGAPDNFVVVPLKRVGRSGLSLGLKRGENFGGHVILRVRNHDGEHSAVAFEAGRGCTAPTASLLDIEPSEDRVEERSEYLGSPTEDVGQTIENEVLLSALPGGPLDRLGACF